MFKSELLPISKSVPQGSILGPVLFTLYMNYITSVTHFYADDMIVCCPTDLNLKYNY